MRADFYIYVIFRMNGTPCYVGKGCGQRYRISAKFSANRHLRNLSLQAGHKLPVIVVQQGLTEHKAFETERALIAALGREGSGGILVNLTDGGEGASGREFHHTEEWKAANSQRMQGNKNTLGLRHSKQAKIKMSLARKGKPKSTAHRMAISLGNKGKIVSDATRNRLSVAMQGRQLSEDWRAKISAATKGIPKSEETRIKMRAARARQPARGPISEETRRKLSLSSSRPRRPLTAEHKAKISAARQGRGHAHTEASKAKISAGHRMHHALRRIESATAYVRAWID